MKASELIRRLRSINRYKTSQIVTLRRSLRLSGQENQALTAKVSGLEREVERLRIETLTDPLTGLYNRTGLRHVWEQIKDEVTAVIIIDSDHFKQVNDRYGHRTGDIVLCLLGETIRSHGIIATRTGGDEFIGLIVDQAPWQTAEKLRLAVATPRTVNGHEITTTITIGLCLVTQPADALIPYLERADAALYRGKAKSRNTTIIG